MNEHISFVRNRLRWDSSFLTDEVSPAFSWLPSRPPVGPTTPGEDPEDDALLSARLQLSACKRLQFDLVGFVQKLEKRAPFILRFWM